MALGPQGRIQEPVYGVLAGKKGWAGAGLL